MIVHASGLKLLLLPLLLLADIELVLELLLLSEFVGTLLVVLGHVHRLELSLDVDVLSTGTRLEGSGLVGVSVGYSGHVWESRGDVGRLRIILLLVW